MGFAEFGPIGFGFLDLCDVGRSLYCDTSRAVGDPTDADRGQRLFGLCPSLDPGQDRNLHAPDLCPLAPKVALSRRDVVMGPVVGILLYTVVRVGMEGLLQ